MLQREGFGINHKRVLRLYRLENLLIRIRRRKKLASVIRVELPKATKSNRRWSIDFMSDALADGRRIKVLQIVDNFSHKCHAIELDTSINGSRVCEVLNRIAYKEGLPEVITIDNGPEFIGKALDAWAYQRGIHLRFIRHGKPVESAYIESFNGKFRDECLNDNWFMSLDHARQAIETWRLDYNNKRPHSSLNYMTPEEFLQKVMAQNEAKNSHL
jgi:putative transposase